MKPHNTYSNEDINAYIDGELDSEERAGILFDEQIDDELAQRINETRILKEKIQLTYSDIKKREQNKVPFSCTVFATGHRSFVVILLLFSVITGIFTYNMRSTDELIAAKQLINHTQAIPATAINTAVGKHKRVVINISQYQPQNFGETISNIEALLKSKSSTSFKLEIVANKQGLKALDAKTSIHAKQITQLANQFDNLKIIACAKSLAKLASEGNPIQLIKSIMITPSAAEQVAKRTNTGWLYLKI